MLSIVMKIRLKIGIIDATTYDVVAWRRHARTFCPNQKTTLDLASAVMY
jgi:hypothetical protein